ncbi:MAG: hypothetical protein IJA58_00600 [Lachnospiraceae bacterium]|nr:hypothetical protein [Lachnospiraceae bacterium]
MNLWQKFEIKRGSTMENGGISFHYEAGISAELKKKYEQFGRWLRKNYAFPVHIHVYLLNCQRVKLRNGKMVYGSFRWFPKRSPYIRIPSAIEEDLLEEYTPEEICDSMLSSLVHELTHYYQWVLDLEQSEAVSERQANYFRYRIVDKFYQEQG